MVENYAWRDTSLLFHPPRHGDIISLEQALATIETVKTVWIEGRLNLVPGQRKLWIQACEKCLNEVDADVDWNIWCMTCKELTDIVVRGTVIVYLTNGARRIQATIKSPDVDKQLPFTPAEIMEASMQGKPTTDEIEAALRDKHVICFLKYYDQETTGLPIRRYPIVNVYTEANIHAYYDGETQLALPQDSISLDSQKTTTDGASSSKIAMLIDEKQFFSPNTKNVLEDIMQTPSLDDIPSECSSRAKRMLTFENTPDKTVDGSDSEQTTSCSPTRKAKAEDDLPPTPDEQINPSKKSKGKGHED